MACSGASAGTRTRVQALATPGDNHYTTLAGGRPTLKEFKRLSAKNGGAHPAGPSLHSKPVRAAALTATLPHQGQHKNRTDQHQNPEAAKNSRIKPASLSALCGGFPVSYTHLTLPTR